MYKIFVSKTFQKQFHKMDKNLQERVKTAIQKLKENPYKSKARADIKPLIGTKPLKYRIRVGEYRIIYIIKNKTIKIIEIIKRGKGYSDIL